MRARPAAARPAALATARASDRRRPTTVDRPRALVSVCASLSHPALAADPSAPALLFPALVPAAANGAGLAALYAADSVAIYEGNVFLGGADIAARVLAGRLSGGPVMIRFSNCEAQFTATNQCLIAVTGESTSPVRAPRAPSRASPAARARALLTLPPPPPPPLRHSRRRAASRRSSC